MTPEAPAPIGVVVIGRNEGVRLERCLDSVVGSATRVVYVDSGSTDASVGIARERGAELVELDMSEPFTAARARNEGFKRLLALLPRVRYVQFVDGDCELVSGWLSNAASFLEEHPDVAIVSGRLRERSPEQSIYNLLCDMEWDTPIGQARICGGIAMARADTFEAMQGFRALIAGEEPELCVRLRQAGWKIWRLDAEMGRHDAAIMHFGQWWRRAMRGGHAFAEGAYLHGAPPERHWVRETWRAWIWGGAIPLGIMVSVFYFAWSGMLLLAVYPLQVIRLAMKGKRSKRENYAQAFFLVLGKFPEMLGQLKFWIRKIGAGKATLIEYK